VIYVKGGVGGIFAPSLFMGGITGFFVARLVNFFEPSGCRRRIFLWQEWPES
jgi:H+/Cl- antiporter ClcA